MKPSRYNLTPLSFEMFYEHSTKYPLPLRTQPCTVHVKSVRKRRDLLIEVVVEEGEPDAVMMILMRSRIYARTLERHVRHIRMMKSMLERMGNAVTADIPSAEHMQFCAWRSAIQRAKQLAKSKRPA